MPDLRDHAVARPQLWRRLHADGIWLAILEAEAADDRTEFRFLGTERDGLAFVFGAFTEQGLAARAGDGELRLVHVPGHHLPRIWPRAAHLVVDRGTPYASVLSPAEMTGLPSGPTDCHGDLAGVCGEARRITEC